MIVIKSIMTTLPYKYQPQKLNKMQHNHNNAMFMSYLAKSDDMPHLIVSGTRGCGKRTLINLFLKEKYQQINNNSVTMSFKIPGKSEEATVQVVASRYHYQFNPHNQNLYDRTLLQLFIKEITSYKVVSAKYRIIIIDDADLLTVEAQESLRKIVERYIRTCRFIFIDNREGKLIEPLHSRCAHVNIITPTNQQIDQIIRYTAANEKIELEDTIYQQICNLAGRDLSKALQLLEKIILTNNDDSGPVLNVSNYDPVYQQCEDVIMLLIKGSNLATTMDSVRTILYKMINYCVDSRKIIQILMEIVIKKLPKNAHKERYAICLRAAERDESIRQSNKCLYHIEAFCLYTMSVIKLVMHMNKPKKVAIKAK